MPSEPTTALLVLLPVLEAAFDAFFELALAGVILSLAMSPLC